MPFDLEITRRQVTDTVRGVGVSDPQLTAEQARWKLFRLSRRLQNFQNRWAWRGYLAFTPAHAGDPETRLRVSRKHFFSRNKPTREQKQETAERIRDLFLIAYQDDPNCRHALSEIVTYLDRNRQIGTRHFVGMVGRIIEASNHPARQNAAGAMVGQPPVPTTAVVQLAALALGDARVASAGAREDRDASAPLSEPGRAAEGRDAAKHRERVQTCLKNLHKLVFDPHKVPSQQALLAAAWQLANAVEPTFIEVHSFKGDFNAKLLEFRARHPARAAALDEKLQRDAPMRAMLDLVTRTSLEPNPFNRKAMLLEARGSALWERLELSVHKILTALRLDPDTDAPPSPHTHGVWPQDGASRDTAPNKERIQQAVRHAFRDIGSLGAYSLSVRLAMRDRACKLACACVPAVSERLETASRASAPAPVPSLVVLGVLATASASEAQQLRAVLQADPDLKRLILALDAAARAETETEFKQMLESAWSNPIWRRDGALWR